MRMQQSSLSVKKTLRESVVNRSTFYNWYRRYLEHVYDGLTGRKPGPKKFWNKIPEHVKEHVVSIALDQPDKSPRELAWFITYNEGYFISESSAYRILMRSRLIIITIKGIMNH
jgi:putative transposase